MAMLAFEFSPTIHLVYATELQPATVIIFIISWKNMMALFTSYIVRRKYT